MGRVTNVSVAEFDGVGGPVDDMCRHVQATTSQLLGTTIRFTEEDWAAPSALPGWTRAHVAAHLADNARRLRRLATHASAAESELARDDARRIANVEAATALGPLELQIALDTTAGELATAMHDVPPERFELPVTPVPGVTMPLRLLPLVRLSEVVLHHCDLLDGYSLDAVDHEAVLWCLQLRATLLIGRRTYPAVRIVATEGIDITIGRPGVPEIARGDARLLLGWLTGRTNPPAGRMWPELPTP